MNEVIANLDILEVLSTIWTVILLPILTYMGKQAYAWMKSKQVDKYGKILYDEAVKAVKAIYQESVEDIKKTSDWTPEKQKELKEIAKAKIIQALTSTAYQCLKEANDDFEDYLDTLVETALYDVKHQT